MEAPSPSRQHFDLFQIPSLVTTLFALTILMVLFIVFSSVFTTGGLVCGWWLPIITISLSFYDWFTGTDRHLRRSDYQAPAPDAYPQLQAAVKRLAPEIGLNTPPEVVISTKHYGVLEAFGGVSRQFIGASGSVADLIEADLADPAKAYRPEAVLLHEMAHFVNGDVRLIRVVESSLRQILLFAVWAFWILVCIALIAFALTDAEEMFSQAYLNQIVSIAPILKPFIPKITPDMVARAADPPSAGLAGIFIIQAFLPIFLACLLIWLIFFRQMHQIREFYADARAAQVSGPQYYNALRLYLYLIGQAHPPLNGWRRVVAEVWGRIAHLVPFHPKASLRTQALKNPALIFSSPWRVGLTAGLLLLPIELLLGSAFASAGALNVPGVFSLVLAFLLITLSAWPAIYDLDERWRKKYWQAVLGAGLVWSIFVGLALLLVLVIWLLSPVVFTARANLMVNIIAGKIDELSPVYTAETATELLIGLFVFQFYRLVALLGGLWVGLRIDHVLRRRMLMWHISPGRRRIFLWLSSLWVAAGLVLIHIILNGLFFPDGFSLFSLGILIICSVLALVLAVGTVLFIYQDRQPLISPGATS